MTLNTQLYYFGYGSLVNRATRPPEERPIAVRLPGWQRQWAHRSAALHAGLGSCALTVEPCAERPSGAGHDRAASVESTRGWSIDGVLVPIDAGALPGLDAREAGYDRVELPTACFACPVAQGAPAHDGHVIMYVSKPHLNHPACARHPILQSYVDCVLAGFLERFGTAGVQRFLATTQGWQGTLEDDRLAPRYPRAQLLDPALLAQIDGWVAAVRTGILIAATR